MEKSRCTVCRHPQRNEIDHALIGGASERSTAKRFDVSSGSIHRHKTAHLPISLTRALERRVEKEEDDLLEYSIANRDERLRAQTERWSKIHEKALELLDDGDIKGASGLLKESRELEKMVAQEHGQFNSDKAKSGQSGPFVFIVKPQIDVSRQQPRELPVAQILEYPDGAPSEVLDGEFVELPAAGSGNGDRAESGGDDGPAENPGQARCQSRPITDFV